MFSKIIAWLERRLNLSEIFSFLTTFGISYGPLNPNLPVSEVTREAFLRPLPSYERWPHIFGILTFVTFLMEVMTGLLLALYFQPSAGTAYETTRLIIRDTTFGWYIHQMHFWGGQLLAVLLLLRLLRFLMHRVYRSPRELTWVFGVILFLLAIQSCFTGRLLPWDQDGYWETVRGLELFGKIPLFGSLFHFFLGEFALSGSQLLRFYLLHVIFLPILIFVFFYLHLATVRRVGLSQGSAREEKARPIYPGHLMNLLIILLALFGGLLTLAIFFPARFSTQADPFQTPAGVSVSWYVLALYGLFELLPRVIASWIAFLGLWLLLLVPFVDRENLKSGKRRLLGFLGILLFFFVLFLSYYGYHRRG